MVGSNVILSLIVFLIVLLASACVRRSFAMVVVFAGLRRGAGLGGKVRDVVGLWVFASRLVDGGDDGNSWVVGVVSIL